MEALEWGPLFPAIDLERAGAAFSRSRSSVFIYLRVDEEGLLVTPGGSTAFEVRVYEMSAREPLCPINRERAMRFREVATIEEAKTLAETWSWSFDLD